MSNVNISIIRDTLHKGMLVSSGAPLPKEAFKRLLNDPKFKEQLGGKLSNAGRVIQQIKRNTGELKRYQAEAVFDAFKKATESGVELEGYGGISLSHRLDGIRPKELVRKLVKAGDEQAEPKIDYKALRLASRRLGQRALENVRQGIPITARLTSVPKIRKGQLRAEAQEKREEVFSKRTTDTGTAYPASQPLVQESGRISGATASYLTGQGAEAPLKTADDPEEPVPIVAPDEGDQSTAEPVEMEID